MLEKTQKEQADIKKELSQNESVLNTEEKTGCTVPAVD